MGAARSPLSANEGKRMQGDTRGGWSMARPDKDRQKKGKCKSIRIAVCFDTTESISINYMFITSNSCRLHDNKSCCALFSAWRGPRHPPPNQLSLGLYKTKILHMKRNWNKNQYAYLICLCLPLFFYTITVAFTKGPHPLVGCYSIFKHHSAESQPPHRPALRTCNKLSSSETTETSRAEAGQGHFNESHLINIFIFAWLDLPELLCAATAAAPVSFSGSPSLRACCYGGSYLPADSWCYAITLKKKQKQQQTKSVGGSLNWVLLVLGVKRKRDTRLEPEEI